MGPARSFLHRQPRLRAVERLDLALSVDHGLRRRIDVETDHVAQLVGEFGVPGELEPGECDGVAAYGRARLRRTELTLSERALLTVRVRDADAIVAPQPLLTPEETALRIAIMGSGGIGGYLGKRGSPIAGEDVIFIARGAHLEAMQRASAYGWRARSARSSSPPYQRPLKRLWILALSGQPWSLLVKLSNDTERCERGYCPVSRTGVGYR